MQAAVCLACEVRLVITLSCGDGKRLQCTGRLKRGSLLDYKSHLKPRRWKGLCSVCYFVVLLMHELMLCIDIYICSDSLESKSGVYKGIFWKENWNCGHTLCFIFQAGRYNHEQWFILSFSFMHCDMALVILDPHESAASRGLQLLRSLPVVKLGV